MNLLNYLKDEFTKDNPTSTEESKFLEYFISESKIILSKNPPVSTAITDIGIKLRLADNQTVVISEEVSSVRPPEPESKPKVECHPDMQTNYSSPIFGKNYKE